MTEHVKTSSNFASEIANKPRSAAHNGSFLLITILFSLVTTTLISSIQWVVIIIAVIALSMRIMLYFGHYQHVPSSRTINTLAIVSGAFLVYKSQQMDLLTTMINLLVLASSLKIMVLNSQKDLLAIFLALVFLTTLGFIHQPSMFFTIVYGGVILALLLTLALHFAPKQDLRTVTKKTSVLCLQALPLCAVLFILIPPLPPFWEMPRPQSTNTGLTDVVKPGTIANLAKSTELAFSARFIENEMVPKYHERYWRALTLDTFDGEQWTASPDTLMPQLSMPEMMAKASRNSTYEVFLLPNETRYLPSLAYPIAINAQNPTFYISETANLAALNPTTRSYEYTVTSFLAPHNQVQLVLPERYLQVPVGQTNPRTQAWVKELGFTNVYQWIAYFNNYFLDNNFSYTLSPPLLPDNSVDRFLFDTKTGFCSHYASAMGYVFRLAGFPTRLVAGYQGGEMVEDSKMLIHQFDAHAWLEVYTQDQGWLRLDPTAIIAPTRVRQNLIEQLQEQGEDTTWAGFRHYLESEWQQKLFKDMQAWQLEWKQGLLAFDHEDHQALLDKIMTLFAVKHPIVIPIIGLLLISLCLCIYFYWGKRHREPKDEYLKLYMKAKQHCISILVPKSDIHVSAMPPKHFQQWLYMQDNTLAILMQPLSDAIELHLYAQHDTDLHGMKQALKNVKRHK